MKPLHFVILFFVIAGAALLANLLALKIAADQVSSSVSSSPVLNLFGKFSR